jgi:hypothetical protein
MTEKIIALEELPGPFQTILQGIMRMVPDRDKDDLNLQRLLAFRLRIDGEAVLREYLVAKIRDAIKSAYTGSLYAFLKDDLTQKPAAGDTAPPPPPGQA